MFAEHNIWTIFDNKILISGLLFHKIKYGSHISPKIMLEFKFFLSEII